MKIQKIMSCVCFNHQAEEAVRYYTKVFKEAKITSITRCGEDEPGGPKGAVRTVAFRLFGQDFLAVNGGPHFKFTDGISLMVNCETQEEIDGLWDRLSRGGKKIRCGWLTDKFGVSWQVTPAILADLMTDPDPEKSKRVMNAILRMRKLDIEGLKRAHAGRAPALRRRR
jgi:predicted 3-demethylubiquinone-9 3-methyltransferase (glyoxalase superfamily)